MALRPALLDKAITMYEPEALICLVDMRGRHLAMPASQVAANQVILAFSSNRRRSVTVSCNRRKCSWRIHETCSVSSMLHTSSPAHIFTCTHLHLQASQRAFFWVSFLVSCIKNTFSPLEWSHCSRLTILSRIMCTTYGPGRIVCWHACHNKTNRAFPSMTHGL